MSVLLGGVAGSSSRMSGGLLASPALMVSDVAPLTLRRSAPMLAPSDVRAGLARFRRHLNGFTTDATNAPLGSALVLIYDTVTRLLVAALTSDVTGMYDYPIYAEGTTYFIYSNKAGTPEVFGGSSNQLVPV